MSDNILFCAMPKRGKGVEVYEAAIAHYIPTVVKENFISIMRGLIDSSLLTHGFNRLWSAALTLRKDHGVTHFGMIHSDVGAPIGWADTLLDEMKRTGAELISVVIPIKDKRGITSTGLESGDMFSPKRFTMKDIFSKDETFTEDGLLVNTGLWLCDLRSSWCDKVLFRQTDQMVVTPDRKFIARTSPEDWDFSRQIHQLERMELTDKILTLNLPGKRKDELMNGEMYSLSRLRELAGEGYKPKIWATRKVQIFHQDKEYHNTSVWGEWEIDKGDIPFNPGEAIEQTTPGSLEAPPG